MKPNTKANPDSFEAGKSVRNPSTNNPKAKGVSPKSAKLNKSNTHVDVNVHEKMNAKLLKNAHKSSQDFGALAIALNKTTLSYMDTMTKQMTTQTEIWNDMKESRSEFIKSLEGVRTEFTTSLEGVRAEFSKSIEGMEESIKSIVHDLHDSNGLLAKTLAPIKFDLRDPEGHLARALKESEARQREERRESETRQREERRESEERQRVERKESEERIIQAIEKSEKSMQVEVDKKIHKNNTSLLKIAGVTVFTVVSSLVGYAEWLFFKQK